MTGAIETDTGRRHHRPMQGRVAAIAALGLILCGVHVAVQVGPRQGLLMLVGAAMGLTLYHAGFGFSGAWRRFLTQRDGTGVRAQMLMLAVAVSLFFPLLAAGSAFGRPLHGFVFPVGVSGVVGAFLFGSGMQLGGGCGSGTLYTAGGGSPRMLVTLLFFVLGSVLGAAHLSAWLTLPGLGPVSLLAWAGWPGALAANLALFALIAWASRRWERHSTAPPPRPMSAHAGSFWRGPWPLLWAGVALALLNVATLLLAGRPWGITWAFTLWGAKAGSLAGLDMATLMGWPENLIARPLVADITSVMNLGILLGALLAAALAGRFDPLRRVGLRPLLAAVLGGVLLGYGARLGFGCNIGAFVGGIASGSLHGWVWLVAALAGNAVGVRLRPWFQL